MKYKSAQVRRWRRRTLPKKSRMIILADRKGFTCFSTASEYRIRKRDLEAKGFRIVLAELNVPQRRLAPRDGLFRYYRYVCGRLT